MKNFDLEIRTRGERLLLSVEEIGTILKTNKTKQNHVCDISIKLYIFLHIFYI